MKLQNCVLQIRSYVTSNQREFSKQFLFRISLSYEIKISFLPYPVYVCILKL